MTKKVLIGLFILLLGAIGIVVFNFYKKVKHPTSNSFTAVPQDAVLILQEKNFSDLYKSISTTNIIWEELVNHSETALKVNAKLGYLDSLLNKDAFKAITQQQSILTSLHLSGADNFELVFYFSIAQGVEEVDLIQKIKNELKINPSIRKYDDVNIYNIPIKNNNLSFIYYKNIFVFSYSPLLVEGVVRQLNSNNSLLNNTKFTQALNTAGQVKAGNLFINNKSFPKLLNQFTNNATKERLKKLELYSDWTAFDISIKSNALMLNGFTFSSDSSDNYLNLFKNQKPQEIGVLSIAPKNTALLYYYGLSNSQQFFKDKKALLNNRKQLGSYQKYIDNQVENYGIDIEEEFLSIIGNELAFIITESSINDYSDNRFIIFQSNDIRRAKRNLERIGLKVNKEPYHPANHQEYTINKVDLKDVFSQLIGEPFINIRNPYYTTINEYVIFGNSQKSIKKLIDNYVAQKTLDRDANFEVFSDNLSSEATIFIYNNIARSVNLYKDFSNESYLKILNEEADFFRKFEAVAFQVNSRKNNLYYNNLYFKYNPVYKKDTRTLWEASLDTVVSSQPHLVINHYTNAKEIFVQDDANKLYLISTTGKILWKRQIENKIISKVHQVDVYKSNKLQLLFNTKDKIYLIDRNGKNVDDYPIQLPEETDKGVTVLDYDQDKNYRLLISCRDNVVYNFDINGKRVSGWEYSPTKYPTLNKIWHFSIKGKDYIVIPTETGRVKIVERAGRDRLKLQNKLPLTKNEIYLKVGSELSSTYLTTMDNKGNFVKLYMNDVIEKTPISGISNDAKFGYFNVNNNNSSDLIFTYDNVLKVVGADNESLFSKEFETDLVFPPLFFKMLDKTNRVGLVVNNEVYLMDDKGIVGKDFPLVGSTLFSVGDINNDGISNLVVGDRNMIYTYNLR